MKSGNGSLSSHFHLSPPRRVADRRDLSEYQSEDPSSRPLRYEYALLLRLIGSRSNRMGLGAQVRLVTGDGRSQWNEATTSVGYASSSDSRVHFGLGANTTVRELEVHWPSGTKQLLHGVRADQILVVKEP